MAARIAASLLFLTTLGGCAVHETHKDHNIIRQTLLDLYPDQIMDNLVRTANRMPIIQLDYNNAGTQVTITTGIGGNVSQAATSSNVLAIPAATLSLTRTIVTSLTGNAAATNSNQ